MKNEIYNHTYYNKGFKQVAQELRNNSTETEKIMWFQYLRFKKPQVKRQRPIGPYIVDFFVPKLKLVIEIDGDYHFTPDQVEKDKQRDSYLVGLGITIIRIRNDEVKSNWQQVKERVDVLFE